MDGITDHAEVTSAPTRSESSHRTRTMPGLDAPDDGDLA